MKIAILSICLFSICSCLSLGVSSGVLPKGNGVYTISTEYFSAAAAKKSAYDSSIKYCRQENQTMMVISEREVPADKYDLEFKCE